MTTTSYENIEYTRVPLKTRYAYLNKILACKAKWYVARVGTEIINLYHIAKGYAWPSLEYLADKCKCTKKQVIQAIRQLEKLGLLIVRRSTGRGRTNEYIPVFDEKPPEQPEVVTPPDKEPGGPSDAAKECKNAAEKECQSEHPKEPKEESKEKPKKGDFSNHGKGKDKNTTKTSWDKAKDWAGKFTFKKRDSRQTQEERVKSQDLLEKLLEQLHRGDFDEAFQKILGLPRLKARMEVDKAKIKFLKKVQSSRFDNERHAYARLEAYIKDWATRINSDRDEEEPDYASPETYNNPKKKTSHNETYFFTDRGTFDLERAAAYYSQR